MIKPWIEKCLRISRLENTYAILIKKGVRKGAVIFHQLTIFVNLPEPKLGGTATKVTSFKLSGTATKVKFFDDER